MVRVVGIDPGTYSMDVFGFDDETGQVLVDTSIPRVKITENPQIIVDLLRELHEKYHLDLIVGPSGYGVPLKPASSLTDEDIAYATFVTESDVKRRLRIIGLRKLMVLLRASGLPVWFVPGVVHLSTVPAHRKVNKIDLGTADKIFSVVAAMRDEYEDYGVPPDKISLILVEVGFAYNAVIGVENGKIIDGIGGTYASIGYLGAGAFDGEVVYAISNVHHDLSKNFLFTGGAAYIAGIDPFKTPIEEFVRLAKSGDKRAEIAYEAFVEGILKDIARILVTVRNPRCIVLSGRFVRVDEFYKDLRERLEEMLRRFHVDAEIRTVNRRAKVAKEAAEGAAIIANGLAGGKYRDLVRVLELDKSSGTIFDHLYFDREVVEKVKEAYRRLVVE